MIADIVRAIAPREGDRLVEVGPGYGALTAALLEKAGSIDAVEIDRDAVAALRQRFGDSLRVHEGDVLKFDFSALGAPLRVVGNLPYHISTPVLFRIDALTASVADCHFMLQKEVVERMVAMPGDSAYGRLSVMLQYQWRIERLFDVPPGAFRPQPKVWSTVLRMTPRGAGAPRAKDEATFGRLVAAAFSHRRKTLRNALRGLASEPALSACGIDPGARGETLSVADYLRLADWLTLHPSQPADRGG